MIQIDSHEVSYPVNVFSALPVWKAEINVCTPTVPVCILHDSIYYT